MRRSSPDSTSGRSPDSPDEPDHHARHREVGTRPISSPQELHLWVESTDAIELGDGIRGNEPHRRRAEGFAVGDDDLVVVELGTLADQIVDLYWPSN